MPNSERVIKIVGAVCFILIIISLIILNQSQATGYEASIFTFTPVFVWVVVILTFICGLGIILYQLYKGKHEENNLWVIGLYLIATTSLIDFSVHIIRSYVHLGGDVTTHLAYIQNINSSGFYEDQNVYPVLHVYLAQLSQILQIDTMRLILYIPVLFNIAFMLSIYLLARAILVEKGQIILATVVGLIMLLYFIAMVVAMGSGFGLFLGRTSRYLMMIGAIFVGFIFYEVFKKTHGAFFKNLWQKCGVGLLVVALVICFINLVFSSHASRYILAPNDQITQAEITGVDWFIHNKEITLSSVFLSTQGYRLKYLSLPYYEAIEREDIRGWPPIPQPPYHFNYDKQDRLGESYDEDNYMVLNRQDRLLYSEVWPEIVERRFQPGDFEKLEKDNSLDRVYINNGMDIWYIHAYSTSSGS